MTQMINKKKLIASGNYGLLNKKLLCESFILPIND